MILPAVSEAREKGKIAVCKNNLKQMGYAAELYEDNNDGWYAPSTNNWSTSISDTNSTPIMMGLYYQYTDGIQVMYCPSMPNRMVGSGTERNFHYTFNKSRFMTNLWTQAGYAYRKMADKSMFRVGSMSSSKGIMSDCYMDFWGERFGNLTHGPKGYNVLYGDASVAWASDPSKWAASVSWGRNVSMHEDDLNVWPFLFDTE